MGLVTSTTVRTVLISETLGIVNFTEEMSIVTIVRAIVRASNEEWTLYSADRPQMSEELQYIQLVNQILYDGKPFVVGRGGVKTKSVFGHTSRYSLAGGTLPLLTTKKIFTRGIIEELLWMLRGSTDAKELSAKRVHIWDGHTSREHLDNTGLYTLREGDTGPLYGFQFRHSGAEYKGCDADYTGCGVDQIANVIKSLKTDPGSRRHVVCAWNASQSSQMALTPCHCLFQFYIDVNGLSCQLYQRSADVALGVPFNITSYALMTHVIAKVVGVPAYEFIHVLGDAHIYEPHMDLLTEQVTRQPLPFPKVEIKKELRTLEDIEALTVDDFVIEGYRSHPRIKMGLVI